MKDNKKLQIRILRHATNRAVEDERYHLDCRLLADHWGLDPDEVCEQFKILLEDDLAEGRFRTRNDPPTVTISGLTREGHKEVEKAESWYPHHTIERAAEAMGPTATLAERVLNIFNLAALILGYILGQLLPWPW